MLLVLLLSALATVSAQHDFFDTFAPGITNPYIIAPHGTGLTQYLVFHGLLRANNTVAYSRCIALGGFLADVDSLPLLDYLQVRLHEPAYVSSFIGHRYDQCVAVYPGGAVAVPELGCGGVLASICEIPVYGTASISFNPNPLAHRSSSGNETKSDEGMQGLFKPGRVPHAGPAGGAKDGKQIVPPVLATITIYGSIETYGGPCCKCCG